MEIPSIYAIIWYFKHKMQVGQFHKFLLRPHYFGHSFKLNHHTVGHEGIFTEEEFSQKKKQRTKKSILVEVSGRTASFCTFMVLEYCLMWPVISGPGWWMFRHKRCTSPSESKIRNFFAVKAWMETAFSGTNGGIRGFKCSNSFPLNATKHAPPFLESCLNFTVLRFTARDNA